MSGFDLGDLVDLVVCPECHGRLAVTGQSLVCSSAGCRLSFPVREGIPMLLVDEAETLEQAEWQTAVGSAGMTAADISQEDETQETVQEHES